MNERMFSELYSSITQGIRVNVRTAWLKEESDPDADHYVFAYQVEIVNESPYAIQLLRRKWHITDAIGRKRMVSGEGIVGRKPVIQPGEAHTYVSGCNFQEPVGQMVGYYSMVRLADKSEFQVRIPAFTMIVPWLLN